MKTPACCPVSYPQASAEKPSHLPPKPHLLRVLIALLLFGYSVAALANQTIPLVTGKNFVACQIWPAGGTQGDINNPSFLQAPATMSDPNGVGNARLYHWNCIGYAVYDYFTGADADNYFLTSGSPSGWYDGAGMLANNIHWTQGRGMIIEIKAGFGGSLVLVGPSPGPMLPPTNTCPCGQLSLLGRQGTDPGTFENVTGYASSEGAQVFRWNGTGFNQFDYTLGAWVPAPPALTVGEAAFFRVPCKVSTNCCDTCTNAPVCLTNVIQPGVDTYLADNLCMGTNTTLSELFPNPPPGTTVKFFNCGYTAYTFDDVDLMWTPGDPTVTPGTGFIVNIPSWSGPFTWIRCGCIPACAPPCLPPPNCPALVGKRGPGAGTWNDLSSCPPTCGTEVVVWTGSGFITNQFGKNGWSPAAPILPEGHSAWVYRNSAIDCSDCTSNLVVNGSFESPVMPVDGHGYPITVPGWVATDHNGNVTGLEIWNGTFSTLTAQDGQQQAEINGLDYNASISQVITNLSTNCPTTFCFWYAARPFVSDNTFVVQLIGSGLAPVTLNPTNSSWQQYCVTFTPVSGTVKIQFTGASGTSTLGGHIDNVSLIQCCTNPCPSPLVVTCPANKDVNCNATWNFDEPTVTSLCCGTNYTVTSVSTTNSVCPKVFRRIWQIADCLSQTATCTQTVTVVDTTAPMINCQGLQAQLAITTNCTGTIPNLCLPAYYSDDCCLSNCWQFPLAGTVVQPGVYPITLYVSDKSGNVSQCVVTYTVISSSAPIPINTGVGGANFAVVQLPSGPVNFPAIATVAPGSWLPDTATSSWVSHTGNSSSSAAGVYIYRITFFAPCTNNASIVGRFAADNRARIFLNTQPTTAFAPGFTAWTPVNLTSGIQAGLNTLDIVVTNDASYSGMRAELTVSFDCCCTNPLVVICPTNRTVDCGATWNFGQPTVTSLCCGANYTVTSFSTTNGTCPKIHQRIWQIADCRNNSATCTQTVTVVDTVKPEVCCPGDITITTCSNTAVVNWKTKVTDNCSSGLVATCFPPSGSIFGVGTTTVSCTATDACGNVGICSFKVIVKAGTLTWATKTIGIADCFKNGVDFTPRSAALNSFGGSWLSFDGNAVSSMKFGASFLNLPANLQCARLEIRMKPNCLGSNYPGDDTIALGLTNYPGTPSFAWTNYIGGGQGAPGLIPGLWCNQGNCGHTFYLDLAGLPNGGLNLIPTMNASHRLDILVQDLTAVDYARLCYCYCASKPIWKGNGLDLSNATLYRNCDGDITLGATLATNFTVGVSGDLHGARFDLQPLGLIDGSQKLTLSGQRPSGGSSNTVEIAGTSGGGLIFRAPCVRSGVTQVQVTLYLGTTLLSQTTVPWSAASNLVSVSSSARLAELGVTSDGDKYQITLESARPVSVAGGAAQTANGVDIKFIGAPALDGNLLENFALDVAGLDEITLTDIAVQTGNQPTLVSGDAVANTSGDTTTISPIDFVPNNPVGFSLALPNAGGPIVIDPLPSTCRVWYSDITVVGKLIGKVGGTLTNISDVGFSTVTNGWKIDSSMFGLGAPGVRFQVLNAGVVVMDSGATPVSAATVASLPKQWQFSDVAAAGHIWLNWDDAQSFSVNGTSTTGDELRLIPLGSNLPVPTLNSLNVETEGIESLVVSLQPTAPSWTMLPLQVTPSQLTVQWTGPTGGVLEAAPTVNGPWAVVSGQTVNQALLGSPKTNGVPAQFFRVRAD